LQATQLIASLNETIFNKISLGAHLIWILFLYPNRAPLGLANYQIDPRAMSLVDCCLCMNFKLRQNNFPEADTTIFLCTYPVPEFQVSLNCQKCPQAVS
jgi:hypothetical protein